MPAAQYDFTIEQGATTTLMFAYKDNDGVAISLTGYTARMQVRSNIASPDVLLALTTENDRIVIDGAEGRVALALDAETTAAITWKRGVYDLELVSPSGGVTRMLYGAITISREVTRAVP